MDEGQQRTAEGDSRPGYTRYLITFEMAAKYQNSTAAITRLFEKIGASHFRVVLPAEFCG